MRVLLVTPFYAPDLGPSAPLFTMLCEDLVRLGHQVSVIAGVPHYPTGTVLPEFRGHLIQREERNGVDVTRVWVPSVNRARLSQRLLTFIVYQTLAAAAGLRRNYDVLIVSNPALEVALAFLVLGVLRQKPIIFSVHDIYPDVGIKLGVFRHRLVISSVDRMERFCLDRAVYVRVLSEGFKETLNARGIPESKLALIWDWLDTDFIQPMPRANDFATHWGLDHSFVVMYAGNIGLSQGLEHVVEAARLLASEPSIRFVFVGDGAGKDGLQQAARSSGLANLQFIPFQPRELLPQVLASADVSLITLKRGVGADSVPSKCYSILASGRPVIASVDRGSDTWNLIQRANCGLCVKPGNPQALADAILHLYKDENYRARLGANGRAYVVQHHSRQAAAREFHRLLCALVPEEKVSSKETTTHG
jgi:colanic acid biosynthesis glycosyl transferase WcaI